MSGLPTEIEIEEERDRYLFDAFVELIISNDLVALKEFSDSEIRRRCTYFYSYPEFFHQRELQGPDKTHTSTGLSPLHVAIMAFELSSYSRPMQPLLSTIWRPLQLYQAQLRVSNHARPCRGCCSSHECRRQHFI
jgi:hypothetical protein